MNTSVNGGSDLLGGTMMNPVVTNGVVKPPPGQPPSTIFVHVDAGHIFQVHVGDKIREILGPATVKIVNNDTTQPVPLQLTAPPAPGQLVQQIVDENGMLVHLIIKSQTNTPTAATPDLSKPTVESTTSSKTLPAQAKSPPNPMFVPKVFTHIVDSSRGSEKKNTISKFISFIN